ncbi:F-box/kelch-repeat protein At3g23880-like [Papaver somniferum]|uniref:F-box/kelch-repeat protein At3g23880-like n=1 Tax=Papaver somniferum TaxID=3469 RepID=UPI000E6F7AEE|nr:F-box/kelch-repeat protein At3g23880-like [Papaver somniferum]
MEELPIQITANILSSLPLVSKLQSREVCKTWRKLIPKPKIGLLYGVSHSKVTKTEAQFLFSEQNSDNVNNNHVYHDYFGKLTKLDHSLIMPSSPVFKSFMVGSCNGLVCYACYESSRICEIKRVYIFNPVTGKQIQIPIINECDFNSYTDHAIGFGYNRSSNEYKVVRIQQIVASVLPFQPVDYCRDVERVQVYILLQGGTGWRIKTSSIIRNSVLSQLSAPVLPLSGIFAGGTLHWIHKHGRKLETIAFDLKNETFKVLPSIPSVGHGANHVELMVLGGNLCALEVVPSKHVTIWESCEYTRKRCRYIFSLIKNGYALRWVTKFSIAWKDYNLIEPIGLAQSDKCLLWYNVVLSCYDPEANTLRKLEETLKKFMDDCGPSVYTTARATPHAKSLVPLKLETDSGGKSWKEKKSFLY